jgi:DNA-binding beta-propeller fold protein YncE
MKGGPAREEACRQRRFSSLLRGLTAALALGAAVQAGAGGGPGPAGAQVDAPPARAPAAAPRAEGGAGDDRGRAVQQGIAVDFEVTQLASGGGGAAAAGLREGAAARFRFRISDTTSGKPLTGLYPAAWMDTAASAPWVESEPNECKRKVESFVGGALFARPELDLNGYYVLTLNDDATLTVVDPLFGFGGSKLLALIPLASPGEDWALLAGADRLFVALPASDSVAVADTASFELVANLEVGFHPRRVALQPDGGYLWVLGDGAERGGRGAAGSPGRPRGLPRPGGTGTGLSDGAEVFEPRTLARVARIPLGRGPHDIAFSDDSRFAFITSRDAGTVAIVDVRRLVKTAEVTAGRQPVSVAFSAQGKVAYVSNAADGTLVAIDGERRRVVARLEAEPGLGQIAFAPGGRYAFVVNSRADLVHIVDAASNRIVQTAKVEHGPDQIGFSTELAYVRHRDSETVLTIPLKAIGNPGSPVSVMDVPGGQEPLGRGAPPSPAAGIVKAPGANAVLIANPADRMIYFYQEGMAAPMGGFSNYDRQPRAVLVVDRSLRESSPGSYETVAQLRRPGRFEVAFFLDAPRLVQCFEVTVAPDPALARQRLASRPPRVEYLGPSGAVPVGKPFRVRLKLSDPATGAPLRDLDDVTVLCYRPPGNRQIRRHAEQTDAGTYEAELQLDEPGGYHLYVSAPSRQLPFDKSPALELEAAAR